MTPEQVLQAQEELLYYSRQPSFQNYMMQAINAGLPDHDWHSGTHPYDNYSDVILSRLPQYVETAYAYRVTRDMCSVLEFAASRLDESDEFDPQLAPTGCGFVVFDKSLPVRDARGETMMVDYAIWGPIGVSKSSDDNVGRPGIMVNWFNDHTRISDDVTSQWLLAQSADRRAQTYRLVGRWGFVGCSGIAAGDLIGGDSVPLRPDIAAEILADGVTPQPFTNTKRYLHALFLMLNQTITETSDEHVRKTALKRAQRHGLPGRVTVIDLRRRIRAARPPGETLVEWSRRWIVRGHWAWRKCSADYPYAQPYEKGWRVRLWIGDYEKGPDDKPLVVPAKIYNLRR